jgi:hypothetical protein
MIRVIASALLLTSAFVAMGARTAADSSPTDIRKGMTASEVRQRLGPPVRIVREVLYRRHIEQWVYEIPHPIRVQFSCIRGDDPFVTEVIQARKSLPDGKD